MKKLLAREIFLKKRMDLNTKIKEFYQKLLIDKLLLLCNNINYNRLMVYKSISPKNEIDLTTFVENQRKRNDNLKIYYPKINQKKHKINPILTNNLTHFSVNKMGIAEPEEIDDNSFYLNNPLPLVIVPLIIADKIGNRIGYGRGYYDRFFQEYYIPYRIGVSFFELIDKIEDSTSLDIKLSHCITPNNVYEF